MTAAAARVPDPMPVHVGHPAPPADTPRPVILGSGSGNSVAASVPRRIPLSGRVRRSELAAASVDWLRHGLEPRWLGRETVDCAAALNPRPNQDPGSDELDRFLAGAADRGETALVLSMLGYAIDESRRPQIPAGWDAVSFPNMQYQINGRRLLTGTRPTLTDDVHPADRDLGLRLLNSRSPDAPWWALEFQRPLPGQGGHRYGNHAPEGKLLPILVDPFGTPVLGVWVSSNGQQRWYIIPDDLDWNTVLDWLVQQALGPNTSMVNGGPRLVNEGEVALDHVREGWSAEPSPPTPPACSAGCGPHPS